MLISCRRTCCLRASGQMPKFDQSGISEMHLLESQWDSKCPLCSGVNEGTGEWVWVHSASRLQDATADCDQLQSIELKINNGALWHCLKKFSQHSPTVIFAVSALHGLFWLLEVKEATLYALIKSYSMQVLDGYIYMDTYYHWTFSV